MAFTQDFRTQRRNYEDGDTRIGEKDRIWYDSVSNTLRISDGETPGGIAISGGGGAGGGGNYTLPTATTTVKGGVKIDGTTIAIDNQIISVGTVPYNKISGAPTVPTNVSQLTNDTGFITGVSWTQVTGKPTLFSGAYADLSGKPTNVSAFTNDSGYLTSSSLSSYATQSYVTSRGYITSASLPTKVSDLNNDSGFLVQSNFDLNTINLDANNKLHATGILPGDVDGFTAVFAGRAAGIAALPNTVIQSQAQVDDYAQNNFQNTSDGVHSSTEWVATSPNGNDTAYYIDMGINGASWDGTAENSLYNNVGQRDGWLYVQGGNAGGGNLILATSTANTYVKIVAGNVATGDREVARFSSTEVKLKKQLTFNDNTIQTTAWLGTYSYDDLTDKPTLVTSYNDLTDLPSLFSGAYADLTGKPTLVTSYNDLTNKPTLFSGSYTDLTNKPTLFSGSYNDLTNKPTLTTSLSALTDVNIAGAITGQVLTYDSVTQRWIPGGSGGGATGALGYYGSFFDVTAQQSNAGASSANLVLIGGVYESNGISIQDGSKVTFSYAGTYSIVFSLQFVNDNAVEQDVSVWLKNIVSGVTSNVADSTVVYTIDADTGSLGKLVAINPFILTVEAGEQIQIYWQSPSTDVYLKTIAAQTSPAVPRAPAVILTVEQTSSIVVPDSIAGNAATVTNGVYTTDTGTVTNTMLAGSIANNKLLNSSLTVNGTSISLGSSGTVTANTTNALTVGRGLTGTASTFNGSAAVTVSLDTSTTNITATAGATTTLDAATITRYYNVTGSISGTHIFRLPDLTTLTAGQQITFFTSQATITFQLSTGTSILVNTVASARQTTFTVVSTASNATANLSFTQIVSGLNGSGTSLLTNVQPSINGPFITNLDSTTSTNAYASTPSLTLGPSSSTFNHTLNILTAATGATYVKNLNIGTNLNGGTSTINIGTGVTSGTATLNLGSSSTTTTMNGAVTITSLTATNSIVGSITGNAATATKLGTARTINNVSFDGTASITVTANTPNALTIGSGLSGTSFDGSTAVTIAVDSTVALRADTHYIGTTSIALNRTSASQTLTGVNIDGNAATVTDGVYTSGTYANPSWITSLAYSKLTGTPTLFSGAYADLTGKPTLYSSAYIGTTNLDFTRASGSQTLTGVSIDGNAATVTNGLYSTGSYANPTWITSLAYSKLTGAPNIPVNLSELVNDSDYITAAAIPAQFTFNVAADDSTQRTVNKDETIRFIGSTNITTSSDAEGNITITGPVLTSYATLTGAETLTNKTLTLPTIGGTGATFNGSTSGTTVLRASATAGTTTITLPARTGTVITSGDTGTVTNAMLEGNIANAKLLNSTVTIGSTVVALGTTAANLAGLNSVTATNFIGNASTVTNGVYTNSIGVVTDIMLAGSIANNKLTNSSITVNGTSISLGSSATITAANPNALTIGTGLSGTSYTGSSAVTIALASGYGDTQNPYASKTANNFLAAPNGSNGAPTFRAIVAADIPTLNQNTTGSAATLTTARNINGVAFNGSADITVTAAAGTLTGTTLNSSVVTSSLTSVGTLNGLTVTRSTTGTALSITAANLPAFGGTATWQFVGNGNLGGPGSWIQFPDSSIQTTAYTGNAATVTNGVYTTDTGTVTNTMLAGSIANDKLVNSSITINGSLTALGGSVTISTITGNAGTATKLATARAINGVDFDGSAAITVAAAAGTLTGTTLASGVTASSLTSVGTLTSLTASGLVRFNSTGVGASYNAAGNSVNIGGVLGVASNIYANGNIDIVAGSAYYIGGNTVLNGTTLGSNIVNSSLTSVGTLTSLSSGAITTTGTLAVNASGGITTNQTTFPLVNTTATTVNFAGAATSLNMGASTGTTTINNNLSMGSGKTIGTTASITSNAATAFVAGDNAISGVALQLPNEGALRNLTNGLTNMYFDVSTGGTTQGQFQFRSSNAFTNVLTMSPTVFNVNTGATVTARTSSLARTAFNSAIDTEITVDDMRFRISNQGGIFPQVIGNGSSRNLAWTVVAARSGSAIQQTGSTGVIVASNAWTSLYTAAGMDSSGDTYTVTLQDKAASRIYRVTFMRSDNGTTTGYNIIAERLL
jgi:hypothetical protein